jgi:hypothetical protein
VRKLPRHYSGSRSEEFWKRVNAKDNGYDLYLAGCLLQEMEERVLRWLEIRPINRREEGK